MTKRVRKILKIIIITCTILVVGGFVVNWFLTYRLQSYLNEKLSEEISKATDGFYKFSFEDLSIGLFSGELSMKGIMFKPDSLAFTQWSAGDTLPETYFDIQVEELHFKGLNLTWRKDYRDLDFTLFEIKSPDIKIFSPLTTDTVKDDTSRDSETLHDMISPYIDEISARDINITRMNVSYIISDSVSPVIYNLKDADFHAYGFLLNKNSYTSGKLLYSNDFEFIAEKPQTLLYSDEIVLNTNSIWLSTIDSFIKIRNVVLSPRDNLWDIRSEQEGQYLKAEIKAVDVEGIVFERERALNYLKARSFGIDSTHIQYHVVKSDKDDKADKKADNDSVNTSWSLYEIISPILQSITIDKIAVERTGFGYTITENGNTDTYSLKKFDFHANNFQVDPDSEKEKKFWYVDNFVMEGRDIHGLIESNNSEVKVSSLLLNTQDKKFSVSDIDIKPISTNSRKDYIRGKVAQIDINDLEYDTGVSAGKLNFESVRVEYFRVAPKKSTTEPKESGSQDILDFLSPYANYLSVKHIDLKNASIVIHDRVEDISYRLNHLNFYASDFLINDSTRQTSQFLFTYDDAGISFRNFDNLLPGKQYRLKIREANMSTLSGKMQFEDLDLIPQLHTWEKVPETYLAISTPLISIGGFDNDLFLKEQKVGIDNLTLDTTHIQIVKAKSSDGTGSAKDDTSGSSFVKGVLVNQIDIAKINFSYLDRTTSDSLSASLQSFNINTLGWDVNKSLSLGEVVFDKPYISYDKKGGQADTTTASSSSGNEGMNILGKQVDIGNIRISDGMFNLRQQGSEFSANLELFNLSDIEWRKGALLDIKGIDIRRPLIGIKESYTGEEKSDETESSKDIYSVLQDFVNKLSIQELDIADANINYSHSLNGKETKQRNLNKTNLDLSGLTIDAKGRNYDIKDLRFNTKDLELPTSNGFYTLHVGEIDVNKQAATLTITDSRLISTYPKWEFAYEHPSNSDWFDVSMGNISLTGMDYPAFFRENTLRAKHLQLDDVMLQNLKNQQIEIEHNIMPLIYEELYDMPIKLDIETADVSNFSVIYEELPEEGTYPGSITFIGMNANIKGLTNIISYPEQYIRLDASGMFMNNGYFNATWDIPVNPDNDCFVLEGLVRGFDMTNLNRIFTPLASAEVKSGMLNNFWFRTEASSEGAAVEMNFLYKDLKINILKNNEKESTNKFMSNLANMFIRSNNPNRRNAMPRVSYLTIERDPYHSTFNYFWQILQPPLVESVGVSQGTQSFAKKVSNFFTKVKNFFTGGGDDEDKKDKKD